MISIENVEVMNWEAAIRGMRNPMESWDKSDSGWTYKLTDELGVRGRLYYKIGFNDFDLMKRLCKAGSDERKFMRMIIVSSDITAPLYWWKEFDTYKVGTVSNSCSTMHKIHVRNITLDDFSTEHLGNPAIAALNNTIWEINKYRHLYLQNGDVQDKNHWWQMIQLLPSSWNQRRTITLNYEVLCNIYHARKNHKLDEWRAFCKWIEDLPYSELITGKYVIA